MKIMKNKKINDNLVDDDCLKFWKIDGYLNVSEENKRKVATLFNIILFEKIIDNLYGKYENIKIMEFLIKPIICRIVTNYNYECFFKYYDDLYNLVDELLGYINMNKENLEIRHKKKEIDFDAALCSEFIQYFVLNNNFELNENI